MSGAAQSIHGDTGLRQVPIVAVTADNTEYYKENGKAEGDSSPPPFSVRVQITKGSCPTKVSP